MALQNVEANITLDLYNHDTTPATVKAIQLDSETRYVAARLQNVGVQYDVDSEATVQLIVVRPDKVGVQITGTTFTYGDESSEYLGPYAELTQVALAVNGKMRGQFKITSGDQILRTEIFAISNGEALDASTDEWADEYDGYNLEEMATSIETNTADIATLEADVSQIKDDFTDIVNSAYVTDSASGSIAHFVDGADDIPMKSVKVNITPVQSGSGDPSPSNVRAISGWSSVKVTRAGKNVFPSKGLTQTLNGITIHSNDDGSFTVNGTATANAQFDLTLNNELKLQSGQYTVGMFADKAVTFDNQHVWWFFYSRDARADIVNCQTPSKTFTLNAVTATRFYLRIISGATCDNVTLYPILVHGSDAPTEFEPYNGNAYDISLSSAGTVYGGTLDAVSGVLMVDKVATVGLSSYTKASGVSDGGLDYYDFAPSNYKLTESGGVPTNISSHLAMKNGNTAWASATPCATANATRLRLYIESGTEISYSDMVVVYTLATPLTYQLSATEIKSLLGINNVWSDAGDMDVEYRADTKLYIDKRLGV